MPWLSLGPAGRLLLNGRTVPLFLGPAAPCQQAGGGHAQEGEGAGLENRLRRQRLHLIHARARSVAAVESCPAYTFWPELRSNEPETSVEGLLGSPMLTPQHLSIGTPFALLFLDATLRPLSG